MHSNKTVGGEIAILSNEKETKNIRKAKKKQQNNIIITENSLFNNEETEPSKKLKRVKHTENRNDYKKKGSEIKNKAILNNNNESNNKMKSKKLINDKIQTNALGTNANSVLSESINDNFNSNMNGLKKKIDINSNENTGFNNVDGIVNDNVNGTNANSELNTDKKEKIHYELISDIKNNNTNNINNTNDDTVKNENKNTISVENNPDCDEKTNNLPQTSDDKNELEPESNTNTTEILDDAFDNVSTFILEQDAILSRRTYKNFYLCSIVIHLSYLLIVLVLITKLILDFNTNIFKNNPSIKYYSITLLSFLFFQICINLYKSVKFYMRTNIHKYVKKFEACFNIISISFFFLCLYIYTSKKIKFRQNYIFTFAIIIAFIYYFMSIFIFIVLHIFVIFFIIALLIIRRKYPTPKRILKKLKIMKYYEYMANNNEIHLNSSYFYIENETKEEGIQIKKDKSKNNQRNEGDDDDEIQNSKKPKNKIDILNSNSFIYTKSSVSFTHNKSANKEVIMDSNNYILNIPQQSENDTNNKIENTTKFQNSMYKSEENTNVNYYMEKNNNQYDNNVNLSDKDYDNSYKININSSVSCFGDGCLDCDNFNNSDKIANNNNISNSIGNIDNNNNNNSNSNNVNNEVCSSELIISNSGVKDKRMFNYFKRILKKERKISNSDKLNHKIIDNFSHINTDNSYLVCSICCTEYSRDDDICLLPCNYLHYYHKICIFTWLKKNNECPLCRENIENIFKKIKKKKKRKKKERGREHV